MDKNIYFSQIREKGNGYYVKYTPPRPRGLFASFRITFMGEVDIDTASEALEEQSTYWAKKYPVSVMGMIFNKDGSSIKLEGLRLSNHLTTIVNNGIVEKYWEFIGDDKFPDLWKNPERLIEIYHDVPYKRQGQIDKEVRENYKGIRILKLMILFWAVFVPLIVALLEFFSPDWIAVIVLLYSFWKAYQKWLVMTGRKEKSKKELEEEKENLAMRHHHYHCSINPDGFEKLKLENLKEDLIDRVEKENDSI